MCFGERAIRGVLYNISVTVTFLRNHKNTQGGEEVDEEDGVSWRREGTRVRVADGWGESGGGGSGFSKPGGSGTNLRGGTESAYGPSDMTGQSDNKDNPIWKNGDRGGRS